MAIAASVSLLARRARILARRARILAARLPPLPALFRYESVRRAAAAAVLVGWAIWPSIARRAGTIGARVRTVIQKAACPVLVIHFETIVVRALNHRMACRVVGGYYRQAVRRAMRDRME